MRFYLVSETETQMRHECFTSRTARNLKFVPVIDRITNAIEATGRYISLARKDNIGADVNDEFVAMRQKPHRIKD